MMFNGGVLRGSLAKEYKWGMREGVRTREGKQTKRRCARVGVFPTRRNGADSAFSTSKGDRRKRKGAHKEKRRRARVCVLLTRKAFQNKENLTSKGFGGSEKVHTRRKGDALGRCFLTRNVLVDN